MAGAHDQRRSSNRKRWMFVESRMVAKQDESERGAGSAGPFASTCCDKSWRIGFGIGPCCPFPAEVIRSRGAQEEFSTFLSFQLLCL